MAEKSKRSAFQALLPINHRKLFRAPQRNSTFANAKNSRWFSHWDQLCLFLIHGSKFNYDTVTRPTAGMLAHMMETPVEMMFLKKILQSMP